LPELGISTVDTSRDITILITRKEYIQNAHVQWSRERISRDYHEEVWIEYVGILISTLQQGFMR
jgi:PhoPQ-activated pathogenicity-related protein